MKRTKEVSQIVGVSRRTLQYYDDEGILNAMRSEKNYRLYDEETMERIWKILLYKEMGMELKQIKEILLSQEREEKYLVRKIQEIEEQICEEQNRIAFITSIMKGGIPRRPTEGEGETFTEKINEMKRQIKENGEMAL